MNIINFLAGPCLCAGQEIGTDLVGIVNLVYNGIRIGVPIILIIVGMVDMGKAITQQKEDEIKKAQGLLVKKAIAGGLVFIMLSIVTLLLGAVNAADDSTTKCIECMLKGDSNVSATPQSNEEQGTCTAISDDSGHAKYKIEGNGCGDDTPSINQETGECTCVSEG